MLKMSPLRLLFLLAALFFDMSRCSVAAISKIAQADWAALNASVNGRLFALRPMAYPCYTSYNGVAKLVDQQACAEISAKKSNASYIAGLAGGLIVVCSRSTEACEGPL